MNSSVVATFFAGGFEIRKVPSYSIVSITTAFTQPSISAALGEVYLVQVTH